MNDENTVKVKRLLEKAAGEPTRTLGCNSGWEAGGIERLFFNGPDGNVAGSVEIRHGEKNIEHVRVELDVPADVAAKVVALVSGVDMSEMPELTEIEQAAILAAAEYVEAAAKLEQSDVATAEAFENLQDTASKVSLEIDKRQAEIKRLILEQRKDKDRELEIAKEQIEGSESDVEELDFEEAV